MAEIARLAALQGAEINEAKKVLATEATALLHGRAKAEAAAATAAETFEQGGLGEGLPTVEIAQRAGGRPRRARRVRERRLVKSNGEARRQIAGGGLRVNDAPVSDAGHDISGRDVTPRASSSFARPQAPRAAEAGVTGTSVPIAKFVGICRLL